MSPNRMWLWAVLVALGLVGLLAAALSLPIVWEKPQNLWGLLIAFALIPMTLWDWRRKQKATLRMGEQARLQPLLVGDPRRTRVIHATLLILALALLTLGFAGPQFGSRTRVLHKRGVDVILAIDFSKSMLARDVRPSRIERTKVEVARLFGVLDGDRVGVVAFAGETIEFPMTSDYGAVDLFLRDLGPYDMPVGGTAIGRALVSAKRMFERSTPAQTDVPEDERNTPSRVVVLMTDGEDHEGEPLEAAQALRSIGAKVLVVGIGSRTGEPIPTYSADGTWTGYQTDGQGQVVMTSLTAASETQLRQIAESSGGTYFHAPEGTVSVNEIRTQLRELKQSERESRQITVHEARYALVLLPAFLLLLLQTLWPEGLKRRAGGAAVLLLSVLAIPTHASAWDLFHRPNPDVARGNERMAAGDVNGAIAAYRAAERTLPSDPGVALNLGIGYVQTGAHEEARNALLRATTADAPRETRALAYYNLGLSSYLQGDAAAAEDPAGAQRHFREAIQALRRSLRLKPGNRDAAWNMELAARRIRELQDQQDQDQQNQDQQNQDQQNQDQQNQDQQNQDQQNQDQQNQDQQNQDQQNQDQQNQDQQNQDQQNQDQQNQDQQNQDQQNQDQQNQDQQNQDQQNQAGQPEGQQNEPQQPSEANGQRLPADAARVLDALRDNEQNLERVRARARAVREQRLPTQDW